MPRAVVHNFGNRGADFPVHLRIGATYSESVLVSLLPGAEDTIVFKFWTASPAGNMTVVCLTALPGDQNPANDTVRGEVTVAPPFVDVGPTAILAPIGTLDSGTVTVPRAVIRNFGNQGATFPVHLRIGAAYSESVLVTLLPRGMDTVSFAAWTASPVGIHFVVCNTALHSDQNPSNDTLQTQVTVAPPPYFDVGPVAILAPRGIADSGTVIVPRAIVRNFGNQSAAFPVHLSIGTGYSDSAAAVIVPGFDDTVSFAPWSASPVGANEVVCRTALATDQNPANDTIRVSVMVIPPPDFDVGAVTILAPAGNVDSGTVVVPRAVVHNYGNQSATFPVHLTIGTDYSDSVSMTLAAGADDIAGFRAWTAFPLGSQPVVCFTALSGDQNPTNDTVEGSVNVAVVPQYDVGPTAIIAPSGSVDSGTAIVPRAVVHNYGNQDADFPVHLTIGGQYAESAAVSLVPGADDTVSFPTWTASPLGPMTAVCRTALTSDQNPANDTLRAGVTVVPRPDVDVGPIAILAPKGTLDSGMVQTPRAVVHNYGDQGATFPVYFRIGASYSDSSVVSLVQGADDTLSFRNWTALFKGDFQTVCYTRLPGDERPENDTVKGSVTVSSPLVHDVGVSMIVAPAGYLKDGDTIVPRALLRNYGTATENYFVSRFRIGLSYDQQALLLTQLQPNSVVELAFPPWVADAGDYPVTCSTELSHDVNLSNDKASAQIHVSPSAALVVEHDISNRIRVGDKQTYLFYALLQSERAESVSLQPPIAPAGWTAWLTDTTGDQAISGLGLVVPDRQTPFGLRLDAPPANLAGVQESMPTIAIIIRGQVTSDPSVTDSAVLTLQLTPNLEIHNFPNPFGRNTRFVMGLPDPGLVSLTVYDRAGERVRKMLEGVQEDAGIYLISWDGTNDHGRRVARGTYEYILDYASTAKSYRLSRKLVITGE